MQKMCPQKTPPSANAETLFAFRKCGGFFEQKKLLLALGFELGSTDLLATALPTTLQCFPWHERVAITYINPKEFFF